MPATDNAHRYLRSAEQELKALRQRASENAEADAFLVSNARKTIERSRALLAETGHLAGDSSSE